jgi:nucleoside-diphosphate-sugar epimerase
MSGRETLTVAVTGATGFAGSHVVAELLKRGHRVAALARDPVRAAFPATVRVVKGDLATPAALSELTTGVQVVVHLAGAIMALNRTDYMRVNADGSAAVAEAAVKAGVSHFIQVSSLAAREPKLSAYGESKRAGEKAATDFASKGKLLIIRPPAIYGPGDKATLPLLKMLSQPLALIPGSRWQRFSILHAHDLAQMIADAIAKGTDGEVEVSDGKQFGYDWSELAGIATKTMGHKVRPVFLPRIVPAAMAHAVDAVAQFRGTPGMLNPGKIAEFYHADWVARGPGLPLASPITFARGFPETLEWYRQAGWLPRGASLARSAAKPNHEAGQ